MSTEPGKTLPAEGFRRSMKQPPLGQLCGGGAHTHRYLNSGKTSVRALWTGPLTVRPDMYMMSNGRSLNGTKGWTRVRGTAWVSGGSGCWGKAEARRNVATCIIFNFCVCPSGCVSHVDVGQVTRPPFKNQSASLFETNEFTSPPPVLHLRFYS